MNANSRRVLEMLSEGKVSVDEAERLLSLVDEEPETTTAVQPLAPPQAGSARRYLRVTVDSDGDEHVDVRVPLALIKAGVMLVAILGLWGTGTVWAEEAKEEAVEEETADKEKDDDDEKDKEDGEDEVPQRGFV